MTHIIYHGDVLRGIDRIGDRSISCIITSPPYHDIKHYSDSSDEIGYGQTVDDYINSLMKVFTESQRVLDYNCRLFINIGHVFKKKSDVSPYHLVNIGAELISRLRHTEFYYNWTIRWHKVTTTNSSGGGSMLGSHLYPRNPYPLVNYELIHVFTRYNSKHRNYRRKTSIDQKEASKFTMEERRLWMNTDWYIPPASQKKGHIAVFPDELVRRIIKFSTFRNETVLDVFGGSGSVLKVANEEGRRGVMCEMGWKLENGGNWLQDITLPKINSSEIFLTFSICCSCCSIFLIFY